MVLFYSKNLQIVSRSMLLQTIYVMDSKSTSSYQESPLTPSPTSPTFTQQVHKRNGKLDTRNYKSYPNSQPRAQIYALGPLAPPPPPPHTHTLLSSWGPLQAKAGYDRHPRRLQ